MIRPSQLEPWLNLTSGYIQRVADKLPKQGSKTPWKLHQNYVKDVMSLKFGSLDDGVIRFLKSHRFAAAASRVIELIGPAAATAIASSLSRCRRSPGRPACPSRPTTRYRWHSWARTIR